MSIRSKIERLKTKVAELQQSKGVDSDWITGPHQDDPWLKKFGQLPRNVSSLPLGERLSLIAEVDFSDAEIVDYRDNLYPTLAKYEKDFSMSTGG